MASGRMGEKRRSAPDWLYGLFCSLLLLTMAGCASGISQSARALVTDHSSFSALQADVARHKGQVVMLGGKIIETQGSQGSSEITVLHLPLDGKDRPQDGDKTEGRYLIRSDQFLDPALYEKGTLLTVVGTVSGGQSRLIGSFSYVHPLVEMLEIKLWPPQQKTTPQLHFGIGIGTSF